MDSRCSPKYVHPTHGSDEISSFLRDSRSACLAVTDLPRPIPAKCLPMPTQNGFRFDDDQSGTPTGPYPRKPNPQPPIWRAEQEPLCLLGSLQHEYLMAEGNDLGLH